MSVLSLKNAHHSPEDDVEEVAREVFKITLEDDGLQEWDTEGAPGYIIVHLQQCTALLQKKGPYLLLMKEEKKPLEHCC
ncbi:hypothetical protein PAXINDRAFT_15508 [Paxillus involutus ATCC 200175]|uniref:Uncharacterized protein n=1 Tax=Paxillus involutus ATCC 200175 TaxID=664439 RepID=A0A0C9TLT7_PAXIN|nr:hypothetical protein PAXINDRAFT_15508 [Paxillus involutus ATCC 200175]